MKGQIILYLGPVFLRLDREFRTYVSFFSYLVCILENIEPNFEVKLGDEMKMALFIALENCFPESVHMLNCQHFRKSVNRNRLDILEGKSNVCSLILNEIFGSRGIVDGSTVSAFESKVLRVVHLFQFISKI